MCHLVVKFNCLMKNLTNQKQYKARTENNQLVLILNSEIKLPEDAPVRMASAQLEELLSGAFVKAQRCIVCNFYLVSGRNPVASVQSRSSYGMFLTIWPPTEPDSREFR